MRSICRSYLPEVILTIELFFFVLWRLTRELEKKFSDRHVVFVAQRRMLPKPTRTSRVKQKRPRSRTLTNVHERILEDLVYPSEITGKRTRVAVDGSKLLKVYVFPFVVPWLSDRKLMPRRLQIPWFKRCHIARVQTWLLFISISPFDRERCDIRVPSGCTGVERFVCFLHWSKIIWLCRVWLSLSYIRIYVW